MLPMERTNATGDGDFRDVSRHYGMALDLRIDAAFGTQNADDDAISRTYLDSLGQHWIYGSTLPSVRANVSDDRICCISIGMGVSVVCRPGLRSGLSEGIEA